MITLTAEGGIWCATLYWDDGVVRWYGSAGWVYSRAVAVRNNLLAA